MLNSNPIPPAGIIPCRNYFPIPNGLYGRAIAAGDIYAVMRRSAIGAPLSISSHAVTLGETVVILGPLKEFCPFFRQLGGRNMDKIKATSDNIRFQGSELIEEL